MLCAASVQQHNGVASIFAMVGLALGVFGSVQTAAAAGKTVDCRHVIARALEDDTAASVLIDKEWGLARMELAGMVCVEPIEVWMQRGLPWMATTGTYDPTTGAIAPKVAPTPKPIPKPKPKPKPPPKPTPPPKPLPMPQAEPAPPPAPVEVPVPSVLGEKPDQRPIDPSKPLVKNKKEEEASTNTSADAEVQKVEKISIVPNLAEEKRAIDAGEPLPSKWDKTPKNNKKSTPWYVWAGGGVGALMVVGLSVIMLLALRRGRHDEADAELDEEDIDGYEEDRT